MNNSLAVRHIQSIRDFNGERQQPLIIDARTSTNVFQGRAVEELHGDKSLAVLLANVVDGADVRMVQRRGGPGFALKTS